ncbi:MAG: phosphoribosylanthranilate isomerase [Chloroflexota bacterium]|nr:phosphoribosylanthranilate isomerase [Chloroflexota bacterium]
MTYVKICGITNVDDARCATRAGADFLGFVFYPKSLRFVTPERVTTIIRAIRDEFGADAPRCVGVFVDEPVGGVQKILDSAGLDLVQLHGNEPPDEVHMLHPWAFKAVRPRTCDEAAAAIAAYCDVMLNLNDDALPQILVDAYHPQHLGGTGISANLEVAQSLARHLRLILAGGLVPETVGPIVEYVRPWGVDVSSGVERARGIKDHARVQAFIEAVRVVGETVD